MFSPVYSEQHRETINFIKDDENVKIMKVVMKETGYLWDYIDDIMYDKCSTRVKNSSI